jgi:cytochrome c553
MRSLTFSSLLLASLAVSACEKKAEAPAHPDAMPAAAAPAAAGAPAGGVAATEEAKNVFAQRCTLCHGADGRGDGPASANLNPKPRNYSDAAWQASISDEQLKKTIVEGGAAMGKSMMMPPNPDLKDKPQVVDELVKIIRAFKK